MMRKFAYLTVSLVLLTGVLVSAPANAATKISNGVACKKVNALTTVSGSKYKCAKNPLSTSKKLTWLSLDCLNSAAAYTKAQRTAVTLTESLSAQIPAIELGIANETAHKAEIQAKIDTTTARLAGAQAKLAAAVTPGDKTALGSAVRAWQSAVRTYTSQFNKITLDIRKLEAAKTAAINQPAQLKADVANTKANAALICTKGF